MPSESKELLEEVTAEYKAPEKYWTKTWEFKDRDDSRGDQILIHEVAIESKQHRLVLHGHMAAEGSWKDLSTMVMVQDYVMAPVGSPPTFQLWKIKIIE